ncbi:hypothetical protein [Edwardsiella anguillarum]|uniref:hypothetical protein n=1 Tax=Edwardsiella anguillarum TaxID=1821960 RepID=UPI0024B7B4BB|nr:hypothetical protein [Edwardsiella anguillarum]WHQ13392.1 hypothetical protein MQ083_14115 [Edwardsiella anguillarum]
MKTIYIPKDNPDGYIEFPTPLDLNNYHAISVPDDFELRNRIFSYETNQFVEKETKN